ncbi:MAG: hypothetical protein ACTSQE_17155 [Candidatus Heimdallarchaeaceae archaeon]
MIRSLERILEWNEEHKDTTLYREIQVLIECMKRREEDFKHE